MGFGVENPLVERNNVVRAKQQIEVLEGLREEERLLCIVPAAPSRRLHISQPGVPSLVP